MRGAKKIETLSEPWLNPMELRTKLEETQSHESWSRLLSCLEKGSDWIGWNIRICTIMVRLPIFWERENGKEAVEKSLNYYKGITHESPLSKLFPSLSSQSKLQSEFGKYPSLSDNYPPTDQQNTASKEIIDVRILSNTSC